ncbi:nuclear transport factor 2 family protein [Nocardia sp. NPDC052566]|uniref:nuclear transport factor 2 family protein n=1 Tax=Nocardia sp. NPDC052566 TaxID=3364330 RepID=UPI0037C9415B
MGGYDSPQTVLRTYLSSVQAGKWAELPELYAEDAVVRHPFARGASALLRGRDALCQHFAELAGFGMKLSARDLVVHEGADPERVIGEFVYDGIGSDGESFEMAACFVWRVRDGLIVESHDYLDQPRPIVE